MASLDSTDRRGLAIPAGARAFLAGLLALAACGGEEKREPPPRVAVSIPDAHLRAEIERVLAKPSGAPIYADEMALVSTLTAQRSNIRSLEGLQFATNLAKLKLDLNHLSNLTPLSGLTALTELDLTSKTKYRRFQRCRA